MLCLRAVPYHSYRVYCVSERARDSVSVFVGWYESLTEIFGVLVTSTLYAYQLRNQVYLLSHIQRYMSGGSFPLIAVFFVEKSYGP